MRFLLLVLLAACGSEPAPPPDPTATAAPATCPVALTLVEKGAGPLVGATVTATATVAVDARTSRTVGRAEAQARADGALSIEVPCGSTVELGLGGWLWIDPQPILAGETGDLTLTLVPQVEAHLKLIADDGTPLVGRYVRARDGLERPIPAEGLEVRGMEPVSVHGTVHVDGFPPRPWRKERSDLIEQSHSGEHDHGSYDVTLIFGDRAARWVQLGKDHKRVRGAWCVQDGARGDACKIEPLAIRCACPGPALVAGQGWDVGLVVPLPLIENAVALPAVQERCLPGDRARAAGIDGGLVVEAGYAPGGCIQALDGQALEVRVDGVWTTP